MHMKEYSCQLTVNEMSDLLSTYSDRLITEMENTICNFGVYSGKDINDHIDAIEKKYSVFMKSLKNFNNKTMEYINNNGDSNADGSGYSEKMMMPVSDLELTVRASNCLRAYDIIYIGDLISKTKRDLLKITNLGKISVGQIVNVLNAHGLCLKDE